MQWPKGTHTQNPLLKDQVYLDQIATCHSFGKKVYTTKMSHTSRGSTGFLGRKKGAWESRGDCVSNVFER
jgi:hypothetical protein